MSSIVGCATGSAKSLWKTVYIPFSLLSQDRSKQSISSKTRVQRDDLENQIKERQVETLNSRKSQRKKYLKVMGALIALGGVAIVADRSWRTWYSTEGEEIDQNLSWNLAEGFIGTMRKLLEVEETSHANTYMVEESAYLFQGYVQDLFNGTNGTVEELTLDGYLPEGLSIDIDPMKVLSSVILPGGAVSDLVLAGGYLFTLNGGLLTAMRIKGDEAPELVGFVQTPGSSRHLNIEGSELFATSTREIYRVLVEDPHNPVLSDVLEVESGSAMAGLRTNGSVAYAITNYPFPLSSKLHRIDLETFQVSFSTPIQNTFGALDVSGSRIATSTLDYLQPTDEKGGVSLYHATANSTNFTVAGSITGIDTVNEVRFKEEKLFVGTLDGLWVYDVSDLSSPILLGSYGRGSSIRSIGFNGDRPYLSVDGVKVDYVDFSNPTTPVRAASIASSAIAFETDGQRLFIGDPYGLKLASLDDRVIISGTPSGGSKGNYSVRIEGNQKVIDLDLHVGPVITSSLVPASTAVAKFPFNLVVSTAFNHLRDNSLSFFLEGAPQGVEITDPSVGQIVWTNPDSIGVHNFYVIARDSQGAEARESVQLSVVHGPTFSSDVGNPPVTPTYARIGVPYSQEFTGLFENLDQNPTEYEFEGLPTWLNGDTRALTVSGTAGAFDAGTALFKVIARDAITQLSKSVDVGIEVVGNAPPVVSEKIGSLRSTINKKSVASLPYGLFIDPFGDEDVEQDYVYSVAPRGHFSGAVKLVKDGQQRSIEITPLNDDTGLFEDKEHVIEISVTGPGGVRSITDFTVSVEGNRWEYLLGRALVEAAGVAGTIYGLIKGYRKAQTCLFKGYKRLNQDDPLIGFYGESIELRLDDDNGGKIQPVSRNQIGRLAIKTSGNKRLPQSRTGLPLNFEFDLDSAVLSCGALPKNSIYTKKTPQRCISRILCCGSRKSKADLIWVTVYDRNDEEWKRSKFAIALTRREQPEVAEDPMPIAISSVEPEPPQEIEMEAIDLH